MERLPEGWVDTLPAADWDVEREYPNYWEGTSVCKIRVYRPEGLPPVIVATADPASDGTSITNRSELIHYMAWDEEERPWPCRFVEHYPGLPIHAHVPPSEKERFALVRFPADRECVLVRTTFAHPWGRKVPCFCAPTWRHLSRADVAALIQRVPVR